MVMPDAQKLLGTSGGEALSLPSNREEARQGTQEQKSSPQQVSLRSRGPPLSNAHSDQQEEVEQIVADRFEPAAKIRLQQFQTGHLSVASIEDAREQTQKCPEERVPVSAESEECRGKKAHSEGEEAHHVCRDRKLDELPADRNGD